MPSSRAPLLGRSTMASATVSALPAPPAVGTAGSLLATSAVTACSAVMYWPTVSSGVTIGSSRGNMLSPPLGVSTRSRPGRFSGAPDRQAAAPCLSSLRVLVLLPPVSSQVSWLACTPAHPTRRLSHTLPRPPTSRRVCQVIARWAECRTHCAPFPSPPLRRLVCCRESQSRRLVATVLPWSVLRGSGSRSAGAQRE